MARRSKEADKKEAVREGLAKVYTPGAPIDNPKLFSGRADLLARLKDGLGEPGKHFVLYGESSIGKTSLWQVLLSGKRVCPQSASSADTFGSLMLPVLEEIGEQFTADQRQRMLSGEVRAGAPGVVDAKVGESSTSTDAAVARRQVDLNFVRERIARHQNEVDAIVIDQFQKIMAPEVQEDLIELAKAFSDHKIAVPLFFVGVAESDERLISTPEYVEAKPRHFIVRRIPRMNDREIANILDLRRDLFNVMLETEVKGTIVEIASGYPSVAHRLGLDASRNWVMRAFTDFAVSLITELFGGLLGSTPKGKAAVEKAGVLVEHTDLRAAVETFVAEFEENYPAAVAGYEEMYANGSRQDLEKALDAVAASPAACLDTDTLSRQLGVTSVELDELIGSGSGLLKKEDGAYHLAVREIRPFVRARHYLI